MTLVNNNRFIFLLATLSAYFVASPFLKETPLIAHAVGVLLTLVLVSSLYVMEREKNFLILSSVLLFFALIGNWTLEAELITSRPFEFSVYLVSFLFFCVITFFVCRYVMHHKKITVNSLCGAICGYLFIGLVWSYIYRMLFVLSPSAFSGAGLTGLAPGNLEQHFTYYSFVTLTTLGYGDIIPTSHAARMFAWTEAFTGQIYLTIWIARLVALFISQNKRNTKNDKGI